ncbi:kinase-like protein [Xylona heveae TC161]|uniref:Kinase-like protein n=1 Tax=Xylona heveae (strain CBS 132557 / TC161) TaxID=1328760 RepID=A0A165AJK6_XYLHT|nr:kinase-like protein [Xylona heveae TC161]KZF20585.1 kinase-like protein [Xylona heveae TC161]
MRIFHHSKENSALQDSASSPHAGLSKPIKATRFRRFSTLATIAILKHFRPQRGRVLLLTKRLCVKYGPLINLSEASAMEFVARNTSIPTPRVRCSFVRNGCTYIVMDRIRGEHIGHNWVSRSPESKAKIYAQLKRMVKQMRAISPPGPGVSDVDGGAIYDCRLPGPSLKFGPFDTIHDFHKYLHGGLEPHPDHFPEISQLIEMHNGPWPPPVFTHGDLSSLNILARGDDVVGIIDWETAGWFPHYWEYTTAWQVNPQNYFWREEIDNFLDAMPRELAMEQIRLKYFGDF